MKRRFLALLLALVMVFSLAACTAGNNNKPAESQAPSEQAEEYHFVIILKDLTRPFMINMGNDAVAAGKLVNCKVDVQAPQTPSSTEEQIKLIEDAIAAKVDGIIITPADSNAIIPGIEKANAAGIPVSTPNTKAFGGDVLNWAGIQNYDVGCALGELLAESLDYKGNVVLLEGIPGSSTSIDRINGYTDTLKKYPDITILTTQTANFTRAEGMSVMENLLQKYDNINGIGSADKEMLLGANEAIKAAGRSGIKGIGFDVEEDVLLAIKNGEVVATGDQHPESQAFWGVISLWAHLKGYAVPKECVIPMGVVNKDNVDEYLKRYEKK